MEAEMKRKQKHKYKEEKLKGLKLIRPGDVKKKKATKTS